MPRGHGRIGSNIEKVASRRNHSLRRRSLDESNYKLISEERHLSTLILGNTEQSRCIIFTLVAPELDAYCKLATILQAFQSLDQRNHSTALSESPPTIIFLVNLQKEHSTVLSENTCSSESSSPCSSFGMNIMGQSRNRNRRTKSLKDSSNSSGLRCLTADTSSGSLCDSLSPPSFDDLVSDISKVEQPRKRSSKKKGKKKGKHYKRSIAKEDSTELDGHRERSTCSTPVVETSMGCPPACLGKQISEKSSDKSNFPLTSLVENIISEKDDSETNNYADSLTTMMSCMSNNDEMESEAVDSQSQGFAHDKLTRHSLRELKSTSSATKSSERVPSTVYVNIKSASPNQSTNYNDNSTRISVDLCDDAVAGSFQDHWKTDANGNCSNDVETWLPIKDKEGLDISGEGDSDFRKFEVNLESGKYDPSFHWTTGDSLVMNNEVSNDCCTSSSYWSEGVVRADSSTERAQCSSEVCSSNDFRPVLSGKRGRAARKSTARTGKDNHPVWQKVQKMENRRYINKPKNVDAVSPKADNPSKDSSARARVNATSGLNQAGQHLYSYETVSEPSKSSEINPKKKHSSISKQVNHHLRKGSHNGTVNSGRPSKIHVQQKEGLNILPQVNHDEHTSSQLSSLSSTDSPMPLIKSTEKFDLCQSVQQQKTKEHTDEKPLSGNTGSMAREMTSSVACTQIGQSLSTLDPSCQSHKIDVDGHADNNYFQGLENMQDDLCLMDSIDNQYKKLQAEYSQAEYSEPDNSGPVLQKWVPVGRKDAAVSQTAHIENSTASVIDDSIANVLDSKNAEIDVGSEAQSIVPLTGLEMQGSSRSGDDADCSSSETDIPSDKLVSFPHADGGCVVHNELNLQLSQEYQQFVKFETDLDKIMNAANDAYKLQTTAGVPLLAGSPLAEVERFMCSASPVISQRNHDKICTTCSGGQQNSNSLCVDQIHNLSLASLWRWYEEPGCYGLEVKAEENDKSKRLCDGVVEFRAYFVPYLSAMQLFRRSGSSYASSSGVVTESSEVDKASSSSSNLASLPIFSTLLPRPHAEADACLLESTSSATNEFCSQSAKDTNLFDEELIFEYFEHAQPPQRRPLFDKIKELINYDRSSNSQIYGDPSKLECLSLHDLHPASWYAVAWYPIYRIPEGNFRAAFLTYHSLGHFTHQSASSNMTGDFTRITSPVVGLQSYNAKKECWFQPRDLKSIEAQKEESSVSSPSKVLEKRLKTLERTASVMATATVRKGNQRSVNNHPDYNHFSSRW